ncbi:PREDICTED: methylcrotonoyl-CoA carboxylase subunit alpha, mitochondrial isoform X1 [Ceratosolen solmsi marchali]|uniref:Methylcrotonoyl-CoA carboxylase subunit alpha, mitochondrial isoform X1 n=1 Tax=Ceratosolen solmsi marchali TaxID=326594 RepID=A0AAJ6YFK8_9HYME|nr:PREDICTED: methylcrotonoyl-CoA carboxylase subunit alpha, mitochondrial isoform X1 [Ceratosolen solmsi marchali]
MFKIQQFEPLLNKINLIYGSKKFSIGVINCKINIDKILIANRGEIACRIIRTAKKLGIKTVSVYSEIDKDSMHVALADEAYCIGPAPSSQSYLRQDKIISIAKNVKCQAIHPGYGFLSENAEFAELCQRQNIIFIGPSSTAIQKMGIKNISKLIMANAGVQIIKGYHGNDQSNKTLMNEAHIIGFPVMIKAVRGGGGKGMRIAWNEREFYQAIESARLESQKAFGDSAILLEQYITEPRHIEVQIFADTHGNVVHLFERDCTIQRRHQKIIEESPAPGISEKLRKELGEAAIQAAKSVGYVSAGTIEFIMDKYTNTFYFMEMNTRLQVEHAVTEMITGIDLVDWQFRVAAGEELPLKQEHISLNGHALEARVYAENPKEGFLPVTGKLFYLNSPILSENVRVDTGIRKNDKVSVHYDPMIAKLIVLGKNRNEALNIMQSKLSEYNIVGLETNIEFIKDICKHPKFRNNEIHTGFVEENYQTLLNEIQVPNHLLADAALALILNEEAESLKFSICTNDPFNPFAVETGLRLNHSLDRLFDFKVNNENYVISVQYIEPEVYRMRINYSGQWKTVTGSLKQENDKLLLKSNIDGIVRKCYIVKMGNELHLFTCDRSWKVVVPPPKYIKELLNQSSAYFDVAISPMPGIVDQILVTEGTEVQIGDPLLIIVAMKMEYLVKAKSIGMVEKILCKIGENVTKNKLLIKFKGDPV